MPWNAWDASLVVIAAVTGPSGPEHTPSSAFLNLPPSFKARLQWDLFWEPMRIRQASPMKVSATPPPHTPPQESLLYLLVPSVPPSLARDCDGTASTGAVHAAVQKHYPVFPAPWVRLLPFSLPN